MVRPIIGFLLFVAVIVTLLLDIHIFIKILVTAICFFASYLSVKPSPAAFNNTFINKMIIFGFLISFLIFWGSFIYDKKMGVSFEIKGHGMYPTIEQFDFVVVEKPKSIERGDIIVYRSPTLSYKTHDVPKPLIGRVLGLETETIKIKKISW